MSDNRTKSAIDAEYEDLRKIVGCVKAMTRDFEAMAARRRQQTAEIVKLTEELERLDGGGSRGATRLQSPAGRGDSANDAGLQQIEQSLIRQKARGKELCQAVSAFAKALVARAEDLEKRRRQRSAELSAAPSTLIVTDVNGLMPDEFGGAALLMMADFVFLKLTALAQILKQQYGDLNEVAQIAVLKYIDEEYSGRKPWDEVQDWLADTGRGRALLGSPDPATGLPTKHIPDSYRTSRDPIKRDLTQLDFMDYDLGIANVNLKAAALLSGIKSPDDIMALAKYLTTDIGTVDYAVRFVKQAQDALSPLISEMDTETQAQIIVDFVREGPEKFWTIVKTNHGMNEAQLNAWKQAPNTYKGPNGVAPAPLEPNPETFNRIHFRQIKNLLGL